jgi:hypothetical protein
MIRALTPGTVLAALAGAVSSRSEASSPVTFVLPLRVSRIDLLDLRAMVLAGRRAGCETHVQLWPGGGWMVRAELIVTGGHAGLARWYLAWRRVTGIP